MAVPSVAALSTRDVVVAGPMTLVFSLFRPAEEPEALVLPRTPRDGSDRRRMAELTAAAGRTG
ncbi:hypothetical protein [Streptosporangium sp. NPDC003464]